MGFNCDLIDKSATCEAGHHEFWNEMDVGTSEGPLFTKLECVMDISKEWSYEKRLMVESFEKYPWGRFAIESLVSSVKIIDYKKNSYGIHGCVYALWIWIYESMPGLREIYGFRRATTNGVALLDWRSSRARIKFKKFIETEKVAHEEVRHMLPDSLENMYPKWSDLPENQDMTLDNLIRDIIHNRLRNNAWKHEKNGNESTPIDDERAELSKRLAAVENDLKALKESHPADVSINDVTSNNKGDDATFNNDKEDETPNKELELQLKIKDATKGKKKKVAIMPKKASKIPKKKMAKVKEMKVSTPKVLKKTMRRDDDYVGDVTEKVVADTLKMACSFEDTFSNPHVQRASEAMAIVLSSIEDQIKNLNDGKSTVKRIITDGAPSPSIPEHLQPVSDEKLHSLMDWLGLMILIRKMKNDYNKHYSSDFKTYNWTGYYVNHLNGTSHTDAATNNKWFTNVDHLYGCLFVNENHWVALDFNLKTNRIYVYDSIPTPVEELEMVQQCMFLRKIIPTMLSEYILEKDHKKSYAMLEVKRVTKKNPVNDDRGDCAIYAIKYIECLALGKSFDGLCDRNMQALWINLGVEMFDELGEFVGTLNCETRQKEFEIPRLNDS
ncbi:Cysteine proteinases superfamily protein [Arabidopsis thaliana]|uniref:Cysteine proteinases superfamily protein n=1 Tax=Arabidopsis thaliana TaxID=3702 RepID=F4I3A8_ARATH|nr:Cysteine proteinases superfamily protein [Arabidopsis thaliana]AEE31889.1 Cysteine proteinases superfamily protein [Arabidopsis thaliana]|eukprot:NP_174894.1 Cysteine proteinases superfamily protein [Arabidopsis thaliana]